MNIHTRLDGSLTALALLTLVLLAAPATTLRAADTDAIREMHDRAQIDALMWRYVRALDTLDADGYAATYTSDGRFSSGGAMAGSGRDGLRKMILDIKQRRAEQEAKGEKTPPMYHLISNLHLEFIDRDHARLDSYWMTVFAPAGPDAAPRVAAVGRGLDELVRVNGQWLIRNRDVAPVPAAPSP
jgi:hypothetical protein